MKCVLCTKIIQLNKKNVRFSEVLLGIKIFHFNCFKMPTRHIAFDLNFKSFESAIKILGEIYTFLSTKSLCDLS